MTLLDYFLAASSLVGIILGVFNYLDKRQSNHLSAHESGATTFKTENEGYLLANQRAEVAEKRADVLEARLTALENALSYRMTFDVTLGLDPIVEHVIIEHFPERRKVDAPVSRDKRITHK
jgi:hypothetical protein